MVYDHIRHIALNHWRSGHQESWSDQRLLEETSLSLLGRDPTSDEAERLEALLTELRAFYLANPELVDDILTGVLWTPDSVQDRSDLAAWIMLTRVLVNTPDFLKL